MIRASTIVIILLLSGCASTNEFDGHNNHHIRIDDGLFYVREVAAGRVFENSKKVKLDWESKAAGLCGGKFEKMIYQDGEHHYMVTDAETFFLPFVTMAGAPRIEGVVRCESSPYTTAQATEVLVREMYLLPERP
ncbi:hypothetical protein Misp06_03092 [Microbulbifer sp. NBRC 101763]|uniref:hypothetical protein n=1 Tax=Microbulbifer TaxID=48073 RepID=UPI00037E931F|nr:hypothetical protein [Microbulbifer variabilis]